MLLTNIAKHVFGSLAVSVIMGGRGTINQEATVKVLGEQLVGTWTNEKQEVNSENMGISAMNKYNKNRSTAKQRR
jgi:hypothetical protein